MAVIQPRVKPVVKQPVQEAPGKLTNTRKSSPQEGHFMRNRGKYLLGLGAVGAIASGVGGIGTGVQGATKEIQDKYILMPKNPISGE
jgi:hypothetical protein